MALFSPPRYRSDGRRLTGFDRFTELLGLHTKRYLLVNLFTVLCFLPLAMGILYALLSSSLLVLLPASILGGMLAGAGLALMYDCIYRSLRDASGPVLSDIKTAWAQNWRQALLPGAVFGLMLGLYSFMGMMMYSASRMPSWGTIALAVVSLLLFSMLFTVFWPLLVLFDQPLSVRLLNTLMFILTHLPLIAGTALLQILYWALFVLFLPWSVLLLPLTGFWLIILVTSFFTYKAIDDSFHLEERIQKEHPEQVPFYETDEMYLERKQR